MNVSLATSETMRNREHRYLQIGPSLRSVYQFSMSLNLNIRPLRQARDMTIAQLAARVGISTAHMSEVERGKKNLNNHLLTRIARELGVTPSDLIADAVAADVQRLNAAVSQLADEDRARVLDFAESLLLTSRQAPQQDE